MIVLHKEDIAKYLGMDPRLDAAFRMLASGAIEQEALGRVEDSENMYHMTQCYETKQWEDTRWETHRNWIDVQYVRAGMERIDVLVSSQGLREVESNEEVDVQFYKEEEKVWGNQVYLSAGMLAAFYPEDIHRPCICGEQPRTVEKVVFKVRT